MSLIIKHSRRVHRDGQFKLPAKDDFCNSVSMSPDLRKVTISVPPDDEIRQTIRQSNDAGALTDKAAEDLRIRNLATRPETLGPEHVDTLTTMHDLAML